MKTVSFVYHAPETIEEAVALKGEGGDDAKILAGGQSLVPSMNFRLARPSVLIDINHIGGKHDPVIDGNSLAISPLTRHARFETDLDLGPTGQLLTSACGHIGHAVIRNRGTFLGSIAHADPAAEWSVVALALDADLHARSSSRERVIPSSEFFQGPYMTALQDDEILVKATIPLLPPEVRTAFLEFSRRAGDFALVCVGVVGTVDNGRMSDVRIALGGVSTRPLRVPNVEESLNGVTPSGSAFDEAGKEASQAVRVIGDIHGSADYRRDLVAVFVRRALEQAFLPALDV